MVGKTQPHIKRAQKESLFLQELSRLFLQLTMDEASLRPLSIFRIKLSPDGGMCTIFFYTSLGRDKFQELMPTLILYKPSLRKALASAIPSRYTPDLKFRFDEQYEKQQRIDDIFEKLKGEGQL